MSVADWHNADGDRKSWPRSLRIIHSRVQHSRKCSLLFAHRRIALVHSARIHRSNFVDANTTKSPAATLLSEDPKLFDAGDYNLFRYCHNDQIDFTDPMGLDDTAPTYSPRQTSQQRADDDNSYNFIMGLMQRQFNSAISAGMTGYAYSQAWSGLQGQNLTLGQSTPKRNEGFGTRAAVREEKRALIGEAREWNQTSPGWSWHNQCGEQAVHLREQLIDAVDPKYWNPMVVGGENFRGRQHVVLIQALGIAKNFGFRSFILDGYQGYTTLFLPNNEVRKYSPESFRQTYPDRLEGVHYPEPKYD
jgi:hypothetical protein